MKHYRMEPTYKKSVVEQTHFFKDGIMATYEEGYRWGEFVIHIPETQEEFDVWAVRFGMSPEDAKENYDHIFEDESIEDKYLAICGPDLGESHFDLDDYDYDMIEIWDSCSSYWYVNKNALAEEFTDEEEEELIEHLAELYDEGYAEALEDDGWEQRHFWTEIQCEATLVPCDENGKVETTDE